MRNKKQCCSKTSDLGLPARIDPTAAMNPILPLRKDNNYSLHYHRQNSLGMQLYYYLIHGDHV